MGVSVRQSAVHRERALENHDMRDLIASLKLERIADELVALACPAITIEAEAAEEPLPVGVSKLGGFPDLPPGWEWPLGKPGQNGQAHPLGFLAQIDLSEATVFDVRKLLPRSGYLYFFYDCQRTPWGFDPADRGLWTVRHFDGDRKLLSRAEVPAGFEDGSLFNECALTFGAELTLPADGAAPLLALRMSEEEKERYVELTDALHGCCDEAHWSNRLLGLPDAVQDPNMHVNCQLAANGVYVGDPSGYQDPRVPALAADAGKWHLLFQLDSVDEAAMMWGDCGMLYFFIESDRLAERDFSNVWLILECY